jgi:crotonobetainyl-CoA:carnitine CoA-transferase CaiB-like acyl-CoA transferase
MFFGLRMLGLAIVAFSSAFTDSFTRHGRRTLPIERRDDRGLAAARWNRSARCSAASTKSGWPTFYRTYRCADGRHISVGSAASAKFSTRATYASRPANATVHHCGFVSRTAQPTVATSAAMPACPSVWRTEGRLSAIRGPRRTHRHTGVAARPAPVIGAHTGDVLAEAGLDAAIVDALIRGNSPRAGSQYNSSDDPPRMRR